MGTEFFSIRAECSLEPEHWVVAAYRADEVQRILQRVTDHDGRPLEARGLWWRASLEIVARLEKALERRGRPIHVAGLEIGRWLVDDVVWSLPSACG